MKVLKKICRRFKVPLTLIRGVVLMSCLSAYGQGFIYVNDYKYKALETWDFKDNCERGFSVVKLTVGRKDVDRDGILLVEIWKPFKLKLSNTIKVFLDNGDVLNLSTNGFNDYVDNTNMKIYEIKRDMIPSLKSQRISLIRYTRASFEQKKCTATNEKHIPIAGSEIAFETTKAFNFLW